MARLCVRIAANGDNPLRTQPGDVVCIMEDAHKWSNAELNCGQYKFLEIPGVAAEKLLDLMAHEEQDGEMVKRRTVALDLKGIKSPRLTEKQVDLLKVRR